MLVSFVMMSVVFWDVAPYSLVEVYRLFRENGALVAALFLVVAWFAYSSTLTT
jgi:hypothetical protein